MRQTPLALAASILIVCIPAFADPYPTPSPVPTPTEGINLSLTAVSITASHWDRYDTGPLCVKDDSFLTQWECTPGAAAWLEMDLGQLCRSDEMVIVHPSIWTGASGDDLHSYRITVSVRTETGDVWGPEYSVVNTGDEYYNTITFGMAREFRYARLTVDWPEKDGGQTARITEWQIWGEVVEPIPLVSPTPGAQAGQAQADLAAMLERRAHYDWHGVEVKAFDVLNNADAEPEVWGRAMIELGVAHLERGATEAALAVWEQARDGSTVSNLSGEAACKIGHFLLTEARTEEAAVQLLWAMGTYPNEECATWARIDLIDYYSWAPVLDGESSRDAQRALGLVGEVVDRYPERASVGQAAWAEWKRATIGDWRPDFDKAQQALLFNLVWLKYKNSGGDEPTVVDIQARDAAYLAKDRIVDYHMTMGDYPSAILHGEQLLEVWPNKMGGWAAGTRYQVAEAYFRLRQTAKAKAHAIRLIEDFPNTAHARTAASLVRRIEDRDRYLDEVSNH